MPNELIYFLSLSAVFCMHNFLFEIPALVLTPADFRP